jgi:hypothetical protein
MAKGSGISMNFRNWLLSESASIRFAVWSKDGTIVAYIDGKQYKYIIDTIHHDRLKKLARFKPWSALNQIKELVKNGKGILYQNPLQDFSTKISRTSMTS